MVIQDWTAVILGSLQNLWINAIGVFGNILGALIVLIVGLVIASALGLLVERVFGGIKLDKALKSLGLTQHFERGGLKVNSGRFLGRLVYWFFVIAFLMAAAEVLGLYALSSFLGRVVNYIPSVILAALIMLAAVVVANFVRKLVHASVRSAALHSSSFLGTLSWWAIVVFGFLAALYELGIAVAIIQALVTGFIAMLAIAGGIAFGLGGKEYATDLIGKLKERVED